jgi:hypothetical protein
MPLKLRGILVLTLTRKANIQISLCKSWRKLATLDNL